MIPFGSHGLISRHREDGGAEVIEVVRALDRVLPSF
jgi:hypothetical protein